MWPGSYFAARYWNPRYWVKVGANPPFSEGNATTDRFTLGTKESLSITGQPTVGGRWSW